MKSRLAAFASTAVAAGLLAAATTTAAPAQADPITDIFLNSLGGVGLGGLDPASAIAAGQNVCGMLAQPGQSVVDLFSAVASVLGMPLDSATSFTGLAISSFCPVMLSRLGLGDFGFPGIPSDVLPGVGGGAPEVPAEIPMPFPIFAT